VLVSHPGLFSPLHPGAKLAAVDQFTALSRVETLLDFRCDFGAVLR
jgi:hypothetical protein